MTYEQLMGASVATAVAAGVEVMIFGDLFLEDVRAYRERMLTGSGLCPLFPLWQRPTAMLAREMLELGMKAVVTCVDAAQGPSALAGRWYDEQFLAELPGGVDPCGENGEFHTVVVDGPDFSAPLRVAIGETVERDGFLLTDVVSVDAGGPPR